MVLTVLLQMQAQQQYGALAALTHTQSLGTPPTFVQNYNQNAKENSNQSQNRNQAENHKQNQTQIDIKYKLRDDHKSLDDILTSLSMSLTTAARVQAHHNIRQRKRRSSFQEIYRREMNSAQDIEWANTCGGVWQEEIAKRQRERQLKIRQRGKRCIQYKRILRKLQNNAGREYRELRKSIRSKSVTAIDISKFQQWSFYRETYRFLPTLELQSNIALKRWHRQLQVYVAAFSHMRRTQLHWDYLHTMRESSVAAELLHLKRSAQNVLCFVETAINGSNLVYSGNKRITNRNGAMGLSILESNDANMGFRTFTRAQIENKLKQFKTPYIRWSMEVAQQAVAASSMASENNAVALAEEERKHLEANSIDVRFLKHHYIEYLHKMVKILRPHLQKPCSAALPAKNAAEQELAVQQDLQKQQQKQEQHKNEVNEAKAVKQQIRQRQNKQQQQQLQQQQRHKPQILIKQKHKNQPNKTAKRRNQ